MFTWSSGYIYFSYYCSDGRCRTSIGIAISNADFKNGAMSKADELALQRIETDATQHIAECNVLKRPLLKANLKSVVDLALGRMRGQTLFVADWEQMIQDMKDGKILTPRKKRRYSKGTIREWQMKLYRMQEFSADTGKQLKYESINEEWMKSFNAWMIKRNYGATTIAIFAGKLKAFLRLMKSAGRHYNKAAESKQLDHKIPEINDNNVVTYEHEVWKLYNLPLTRGKKRARDVYVFGCGVGLRVEDLNRINDYILVGNAFEFLPSKTGEKIQIPIHWLSKKIYEDYGGKLPVYSTGFGLGKHLPEICRMAGITEKKLVVETKGGVPKGTYYEKCDLITPHTMRRSFATNAVLNGIPDRQVMKVTGHESVEAFRRYIVITQEMNKILLLNHKFFTGSEFLQRIDEIEKTISMVNNGLLPPA